MTNMNMNKKIFLFVISFFCFFVFNVSVSAVNCGDVNKQSNCVNYKKCMWSPPIESPTSSNYCTCNSSNGSCSEKDIKDCGSNKTKSSCTNNSKCSWTQYCVDDPTYEQSEDSTGDEIREDSYWNENKTTTKASGDAKCPDGYTSKDGITCVLDKDENVADKPCQEDDIKKVFRLFGYLLLVARILIPLIIIIMGSLDIFKAVYGQDDKALGKQLKVLVWRIIGGLTIFFLPTIVNAFFEVGSDVTDDEDYKTCANCLLDPLNSQTCSISEDNTSSTSD